MSNYCECPWTGKVFDLVEQLQEAKAKIAAIEALAVRYDEASRGAPQWPHVDSGRAWHWVAIDIRRALSGGDE